MACQKLLQIFVGAVLLCAMGSKSLDIVGVADWSQPPHPLNVVCYIATWANYRVSPGDFFIGDIDPAMCTHLVYAFVGLDNTTYTVKSLDPWADVDPEEGGRGFFRQMTDLKFSHPHLKVLLAIGGDGEGSVSYSNLASDPEKRRGFIESVVPFLQKYGFDGLDLDWEYPGKRGGIPEDKQNFVTLCRELRQAFNEQGGMLLTSAIGAGYQTIDISYDIPALGEILDLLNVMTYDYHGSWDNVTGVNSPLYPQPDRWSVEDTLTYLRDVGAPMQKITLGLPLYGHTFVMHEEFTSFGGPCDFVGFGGDVIGAPGFVGYYEACRYEQNGEWTKHYDEATGTPYMIRGNQLISYDDVDSITKKVEFGVRFGVGGMMVWSMDTDDFRGICGGQVYPMMTRLNLAVAETLGAIADEKSTQSAETSTTLKPSTTTDNTIGWTKPPHDRNVICYVSTWANYRPKPADFIIDNIDCTQCTHLVYAFAGLDNVTYTIKSLDPNTDLEESGGKGFYRKMTGLRTKNPHLKVLLGIGGFSDDPAMYSALVSSAPRRRVFVYNVITFINEYAFDGLDLDWEYPGERGGVPQDKQNFVKLVKELRAEFDKHGLLLSTALAANPSIMATAYDFPELANHIDFFNLMAYDYHGAFDKVTGANSPLYSQPDTFSVADSLSYMKSAGAPLDKVMLGLPFYGQTFILLDPEAAGADQFGAPCNSTGFDGVYTKGSYGFLGYQEICANLKDPLWLQRWDDNTGTPYMIRDDLLVSYDDEKSLAMKVEYALQFGVGGMMMWSVDTDDFRGACADNKKNPLAKKINNAIIKTLDDMGATSEDPGSSTSTEATTTEVVPTTTDPSDEWTQPPHNLNVICYVSTWANYRQVPGSFLIEHIDPTLCTHLMYAFAGLDNKTYTITSLDPWTDLEDDGGKNFFKNMTRLRNDHPHLKVLLAIGGFNENSKTYSDMVSTAARRKGFVDSVLKMLLRYEFNGLDLDWEYPGERGGVPADRENFVLLVKELHTAFQRYDFLLSSAFHASPKVMATAYDLPELGKYLDFLNIMTYDYHGAFDRLTGANSPLYNQTDTFSIMDTLWYLESAGAPLEKVMVGMPFYGQTFVMDEDDVFGFGYPSSDVGFASSYTASAGFMGYHEVCLEINEYGWERHWDEGTGTPFMVNGRRLVSYDDEESISLKVESAVRFGVGGVMSWAIDTDDFQGHCGPQKYPLLRHMSKVIVSTLDSIEAETSTVSTSVESTATSTTTTSNTDSTTETTAATTTATTTLQTTASTSTTASSTTKDPNGSAVHGAVSVLSLLLVSWVLISTS